MKISPKSAQITFKYTPKNCIFYIKQCCLLILSGKAKKGIYHIQHINSYHSNLKKFIRKFNDVSTKYLNNYLIWNNILNYSRKHILKRRTSLRTLYLLQIKQFCVKIFGKQGFRIINKNPVFWLPVTVA